MTPMCRCPPRLVTKVGTGCASAGSLPVFPGPHLYVVRLTGMLVGTGFRDGVWTESLLPPPKSHLWLSSQILNSCRL